MKYFTRNDLSDKSLNSMAPISDYHISIWHDLIQNDLLLVFNCILLSSNRSLKSFNWQYYAYCLQNRFFFVQSIIWARSCDVLSMEMCVNDALVLTVWLKCRIGPIISSIQRLLTTGQLITKQRCPLPLKSISMLPSRGFIYHHVILK